MRLLVVEDQDVFRNGLRRLLEEEGFEVADALDARAALECVPRFQPDVVLMDVNLPGMSGIEATRRLLRRAPQTAVVMLSMHEDGDLIRLALDAGATCYLPKDASLEEILSTIQAAACSAAPLAINE